MRGFKSFGSRKVVVAFDQGLTVITGPNGSGKSNLIDAVRFVLGELGARSLRAYKMADVIFDGSPGVKKSRSAHVAIQFDNDDRRIPIDTDTVTVSREVKRTGVSTYRLNGRQVTRAQLMDILSVAGLTSMGHNMIAQGMITRLADITPWERRKIIEDLIGIAEYDAKKGDAQVQLQQADVNLKIAAARIDEVQTRLENLERERNEALQHNFIQNEIKMFQAKLTSHKFSQLQGALHKLTTELQQKASEVENMKQQREQLQLRRMDVESERRKFDEEVADKGGVRLIAIQKTIGDISAQIASLKTEIESGTTSLKGLAKIREERTQQLEALSRVIRESMRGLRRLRRERDKLKQNLGDKTAVYAEISAKLDKMKRNLGDNTIKIGKIEAELEKLNRRIIKLTVKLKEGTAKNKVITDSLQALEARRTDFESTLRDLQTHLKELQKLHREERKSLVKVSEALTKGLARKDALMTELTDAERTAQTARRAVVEFVTQKSFAERVAAEERAIQRIEEMGKVGAILGVYGRLENLIKVNPEYRKAVEAASSGWFRALVVKDLATALKCVESLKRTKIGRIKLIPLKEVAAAKVVEAPDVEGIIGPATALIKCRERYVPAVNFVFGDTIVASGERSAFLASKAGYRSVDLSGDLYEAGGGIESGYYRAPIETSSIIPSEDAIDGLDESVKALETMLGRRKTDIDAIEEEIDRLSEERFRRSSVVSMMEHEVSAVGQNVNRIKQNIKILDKRMRRLRRYLDKEKDLEASLRSKRVEPQKQMAELIAQRKSLKLQIKPTIMTKYERNRTELDREINNLQRQLVKVESDVGFVESNLETTLKPEFKRTKIDIKTLDKRVSVLEEKIAGAKSALDEATKQLSELENSKERLSETLASVKDERRKFEDILDKIDAQLRKLNSRYDPLSNETHRIELEIQTRKADLRHLEEELHSLGCAAPLAVKPEALRDIRASLDLMSFELEKLGSVNQLAIHQYDEQKDNYKQLSTRRNQLEGEKRSILQFMEEIERRKREAFARAYNQVNDNFKTFFSKLTGGGNGWLSLQNPENPLAGGLDIFVQFPGKSPRLVAGASGGEKSVAAVSFIFSVQSLSPAPFYMFDEIDVHLDPYNVERLADLLRGQSTGSQFVVITLRDVVIDRAERLFGVYVQGGVSRMVSVKLEEAVA